MIQIKQMIFLRKQTGFTLIELMITVAVLGIIAAIALPNYTQYVQRSHRSNARNALIQASQWMERAANSTGTYPLSTVPGQIPAALLAVEGGRYTVTLTSTDGTTYLMRAVPTAVQASDPCGTLQLNQINTRDTFGRTAAQIAQQSNIQCWSR